MATAAAVKKNAERKSSVFRNYQDVFTVLNGLIFFLVLLVLFVFVVIAYYIINLTTGILQNTQLLVSFLFFTDFLSDSNASCYTLNNCIGVSGFRFMSSLLNSHLKSF